MNQTLTKKCTVRLYATFLLALFSISSTFADDCTFTKNAGNWGKASNWSCGHVPDPSVDNVIIPAGSEVNNNVGDIVFTGGTTLTINGTLDMKGNKLEMKGSGGDASTFFVASTGDLKDASEFFILEDAQGTVASGGSITVLEHLKVDDNGAFEVNSNDVEVTDKFENLGNGNISGSGIVTFSGTIGNYTDNSSVDISVCVSSDGTNCDINEDNDTPLPVKFISFHVTTVKEGVLAEWATGSEFDNKSFRVERSIDHINWMSLVELEGRGNSEVITEYSFVDREAVHGINFYRIVQVDLDGSISYSPVQTIVKDRFEVEELILSRRGTNNYMLEGEGHLLEDLQIYCIQGKKLNHRVDLNQLSNTNLSFSLDGLPSGVYILRTNEHALRVIKH
ncbi:hypothetical protein [Sediminitomix flava]|uniref:Secreted protein (Por secretion system target) n=1 Tax=Sediminitomix flava TaxID=379075 RepID=A0A315ZAK4_SEDFL|nr:hypothetical protein [Sediminitomix flava]PWJ42179.1 hypothetical protein BC781_103430 [Sediminitomix flava]